MGYVQNGDVSEWEWGRGEEPSGPVLTAGWVVPDAEYDPTTAPDPEVSPAERAPENPGQGLKLHEEAEPVAAATSEAEPSGGLNDMTKADLVKMASDANVEGFSTMTKAELVTALGG